MMQLPVTESKNLIAGQWRTSPVRDEIPSPVGGGTGVFVHQATRSDVDRAVAAAVEAGMSWGATPAYERSALLSALADRVRARFDSFVAQMTAETGRPIRESRTEVERSVATLDICADEAKHVSGRTIPMDAAAGGAGKLGFTMRYPVGVIACITPFNAPLNSICHKIGPALAAGNSVVLKPHHHGSGMATLIGEAAAEAGLSAGLYNVVHGAEPVGSQLIKHPDVAFVNFTGSGAVAEKIVASMGLKRSLLELGGNAPTIVDSDADLDRAVRQLLGACFGLSGQSCISTQRLYVHEDVYETFRDKFTTSAKSLVAGDIWDEATEIGPMIAESAAIRVQSWVDDAVSKGATLLCGGHRSGAYYDPTVLEDVPKGMDVYCMEVFGPIVSLVKYNDIQDAIDDANATPWGLKAGLYSNSFDSILRGIRGLRFGAININAPSRSRLDLEPSGGVKASGWGKEGPRYAILEMTEERMISLASA